MTRFSNIKVFLLICLCLQKLVKGNQSFIVSFQTDVIGPFAAKTNSMIEFSNPISSTKEFTVCHWLKIKFYNLDIAACTWAYCFVQNDGDKMKCLQICLQGVYETMNRNLYIIGELPLQSYDGIVLIKRQLKNYRHRTWTHLCWSFSAITGISKFYHDGILLGIDKVNVTENDYAIHGSDRMLNTSLILGQEPDSFRGGFDKAQSYIGELAEFNIWNYELNGLDISNMASCSSMPKGNVASWDESNWVYNNAHINSEVETADFC